MKTGLIIEDNEDNMMLITRLLKKAGYATLWAPTGCKGLEMVLSHQPDFILLDIQLPDLKTRLNWGLTLKLKPLTENDSINALIFKANQMGFEVSPQAGRFLLTHYDRDLASLWRLLDTLDRASLAAKHKITLPFVKKILQHPV